MPIIAKLILCNPPLILKIPKSMLGSANKTNPIIIVPIKTNMILDLLVGCFVIYL